jgi:hypothetical protein
MAIEAILPAAFARDRGIERDLTADLNLSGGCQRVVVAAFSKGNGAQGDW